MFNSKAITQIQAVILATIIVVAAVVGGVAYVYWKEDTQSADTIKIGVLGDLDMEGGKSLWEGVVLAAEQINDEGGVLGRDIEVIGEDSDELALTLDMTKVSTALTRLITFHKVDYVIGGLRDEAMFMMQDIIAEHKKIFLSVTTPSDTLTQRVLNDYNKYKYYFRTSPNATQLLLGFSDSVVTLRDYSGFNKVAILVQDLNVWTDFMPVFDNFLSKVYGFEVVYKNKFISGTLDFSSYFAAIEASGAEILMPFVSSHEGITLVNEWYDRQSPFVIWGFNAYVGDARSWELTDGKCEHTTNAGFPVTAGYPLTSETLPMREAYIERWGEIPSFVAAIAYDTLRFILSDALERAQTTETDAVIVALEETKIETSLARNFVFTPSHDVMGGENINNPEEDYMIGMLFQWQNGEQVPMYPQTIKEEAGVTYTYPPWSGPWD